MAAEPGESIRKGGAVTFDSEPTSSTAMALAINHSFDQTSPKMVVPEIFTARSTVDPDTVMKAKSQSAYSVAIFGNPKARKEISVQQVTEAVKHYLPAEAKWVAEFKNAVTAGTDPEESMRGMVTGTFFARLGTRDKELLLELAGKGDVLLRRRGSNMSECPGPGRAGSLMSQISEDFASRPPPPMTASDRDKMLCTEWTEIVESDRAVALEALREWKELFPKKWELSGGTDAVALDHKEDMLVEPDQQPSPTIPFGHRPVFVRFTHGHPDTDMTHARTLIQNINGKELFGQKVQADFAFRFRELLGTVGKRTFNSNDILDVHALNKVLMWVWSARDELIPDTIQQEFTKEHWDAAWRNVLASHLRATDDAAWVQAFAVAFPDIRKNRPGNLVKYTGEPSNPSKNSWLGEYPPIVRPKPAIPILDENGNMPHTAEYHYGFHDGGTIQQFELELAAESYKILSEVFTSLDADGGGRIDRSELEDFFSSERDEKGLDRPTWRQNRDWEEFCDDHEEMRDAYAFSGARAGKGTAQKQKMDSDRNREQEELRARTARMKEKLFEDQKRACCLNMTDAQFKALVRALLPPPDQKKKTEPGQSEAYEAPNVWLANEEFPPDLEEMLRREATELSTSFPFYHTVHKGSATAEGLLDQLGFEFQKNRNVVGGVTAGGRLAKVGPKHLGSRDFGSAGTTGDCLSLTGWVLSEVAFSTDGCTAIRDVRIEPGQPPCASVQRIEYDMKLHKDGESFLHDVLESVKSQLVLMETECLEVEFLFCQHVAYGVTEGVPSQSSDEYRRQKSVYNLWNGSKNKGKLSDKAKSAEKHAILEKYLMRGDFDKVSFGLPNKILDRLNIPDAELVKAPGFIVSKDDKDRLELKAAEYDIKDGSASYELIFGSMIDEDEFMKA
eukprot:Hpha_TRINITY_DN16966_c0_g2::TRINITY_DN16966_c0_g2_i3::g.52214::m.52214